jgi:hypothetical protein
VVDTKPSVSPGAIPIAPTPTGTARGRVRPRRKSSHLPIVWIGGVAAALLLAVLGAFALMSGPGESDEETGAAAQPDDADWSVDAVPGVAPTTDRPRRRRPLNRRSRRMDELPETDFGLRFPPPGDDTSRPDEIESGTFELPTQEEQVQQSLAAAREALGVRDLRLARNHLADAERAAAGTGQSEQVDDLRLLIGFYDEFTQAVRRGVRSIRSRTEFQLGGRTVTMVDLQGTTLTYHDGTAEQQVDFSDLSPDDAVTFARHLLLPDDAIGNLHVATFLAFDKQGDRRANLAEAKRLWHVAAQQNLRNAALGRELGIYDDVVDEPTAPDEQPGVEPPPFVDTKPDGASEAGDRQPGGLSARKPVPDHADLRSARLRVGRDYRQQFVQAPLPDQKRELAKDIYRAALNERDDAYRYALMEKIRDMAVDLVEPEALVNIVDEMAAQFDVDADAEKATYLAKSVMSAKLVAQTTEIFDHAQRLYDEALDERRYEAAAALADVAVRAARKAQKYDSLEVVEGQLESVEKIVGAKQKAEAARETLEKTPYDSAASEALGRYQCFYEENWSDGLAHLAKASDEQLQKLATAELAQPRAAAEQIALAEAWLALGEETGGLSGDAMRRRALRRFRHLAPYLAGDEKSRVDQRIAELAAKLDEQPGEKADDGDKADAKGKAGNSGPT